MTSTPLQNAFAQWRAGVDIDVVASDFRRANLLVFGKHTPLDDEPVLGLTRSRNPGRACATVSEDVVGARPLKRIMDTSSSFELRCGDPSVQQRSSSLKDAVLVDGARPVWMDCRLGRVKVDGDGKPTGRNARYQALQRSTRTLTPYMHAAA